MSSVLGVDFGTSNSAAGIAEAGRPRLLEIDAGAETLPTAVFFDFDAKRAVYGQAANDALIDGAHGRYMRGLKSLLGSALMREKRLLLGERLDFIEIAGRFLAHVKARAEAAAGRCFDAVVSGRPVVFHPDPERDARAEADLRAAYRVAGFAELRFLPEPEAAALAYGAAVAPGALGLVVDIGGGTSDFTLFRAEEGRHAVLGNHGLRLGGTDLDRLLSLARVMPLLGKGTEIRHAFGGETHLAPNAIYADLATWAKIPFLYAPEPRRLARELARHAVAPERLGRLVTVLTDELGHDLAFAVEAGKIAANGGGAAGIDLACLERGLRPGLDRAALAATLGAAADRIGDAALEAVARMGEAPEAVAGLVLVGGTSLMEVVVEGLRARFPGAEIHRGAALTAVADGLALAAG